MRRKSFIYASFVLVIIFLVTFSPASAQSQKPQKIAVVDLQALLNESEIGKHKLAELQKLEERYRAEMIEMQEQIRAKEDKLQQLPFSISEEKRLNLARDVENDRITLKRKQSDAERELSTRQNDAMMELYAKIVPVIEELGKTKGYAVVINKIQPGVLLYWATEVEITQDVIKKLNEKVGKSKK